MAAEWRNWARDQVCRPAEIERPASVEDVVAAVKRARDRGLAVKAPGSGHSFTEAALTDGVMVDVARMSRLLEGDRETGRVRVEAGMTMKALNVRPDELGLGMENLGDIDMQTLAGAISTG